MVSIRLRTLVAMIAVLAAALAFAGCAGSSGETQTEGAGSKDNLANSGQAEGGNQGANSAASDQVAYSGLSESEKQKFVKERAVAVLKQLGQFKEESLSDDAVGQIKRYVDSYASRAGSEKLDDCTLRNWIRSDLGSVLVRGSKAAPYINKSFADAGIASQVGLYVAMIETEFCPCLQSPAGPLGIFQLTANEGEKFGLAVRKGASQEEPDDRCDVEKASAAQAKRIAAFKDRLISEFDSGDPATATADVALLMVAGHNVGFDKLLNELPKLEKVGGLKALGLTAEDLPESVRNEASKYVPKFIAAAIVGENPSRFGMKDRPALSSVK